MMSSDSVELERSKEQFTDVVYSFKLIMVGDTGVGKTCLIMRIDKDKFEEAHTITLGGDFSKLFYVVNKKKVKVQLWDTCGLEQYRAMMNIYFKGADASVVVFDLTDEKSFYAVQRWVADVRANTSASSLIYLAGNKCDLPKRAVPIEAIDSYVSAAGIRRYFEVSAKTSTGMEALSKAIISDIFTKKTLEEATKKKEKDEEDQQKTIKITEAPTKKKPGCCDK